jgi:hypothetical protein
MGFERHTMPLARTRTYVLRQLKFAVAALVFVGASLGMGVWGYAHYAGFSTVDAFLNASMILGGMGPIGDLPNDDAKWFASFYALYSGIALLTTVAVLLAPLVHRILHVLHLDDEEKAERRHRARSESTKS